MDLPLDEFCTVGVRSGWYRGIFVWLFLVHLSLSLSLVHIAYTLCCCGLYKRTPCSIFGGLSDFHTSQLLDVVKPTQAGLPLLRFPSTKPWMMFSQGSSVVTWPKYDNFLAMMSARKEFSTPNYSKTHALDLFFGPWYSKDPTITP